MAKHTAIFDIDDRATRKLALISDKFRDVDTQSKQTKRSLDKLNNTTAAPKIIAIDETRKTIDKVTDAFGKVDNQKAAPKIIAIDKARKTIDKVTGALGKIDNQKTSPKIVAIDKARKTIDKVMDALRKVHRQTSAPKVIAIDETRETIDRITDALGKVDGQTATLQIIAIDKARKTIDKVTDALGKAHDYTASPTIQGDDRLTADLSHMEKRLDSLDSEKATPTVDVQDHATPTLERIQGMLAGMNGATLTIGAATGIAGMQALGSGSLSASQDAKTAATTGIPKEVLKHIVDEVYYGKNIGASRQDVATSFANIQQQTGREEFEVKQGAIVSNQIAVLRDKDIPEVDRALSSMMNNFGTDANTVGDHLAFVFKNAGDQYDDLLDTFNEYSSTFVDMGLGIDRVSAAFVAGVKNGGRNFDDLADSMREFNIRRQEMTEDQVAAFQRVLGKKETEKMFKGFEDGSYSGQEALYRLAGGLSKIENESERAALATVLIGTKYEDMKQPILSMADAIDEPIKATGELNKQWDYWTDNNPMTPIADAGRDVKKVLSEIGESVINEVAPAFEDLNGWMESEKGQRALEDMGDSITAFTGLVSDTLVPAIQYGVEHWSTLQPILIGVGSTMVGLAAASWLVIRPLQTMQTVSKLVMDVFGKGKTKNIDDTSDKVDKMGKKSKMTSKEVDSLTKKLTTLFKLNPPKWLSEIPATNDSPNQKGKGKGKNEKKNEKSTIGKTDSLGKKGILSSLGKGAGKALLPVGLGLTAWDIFSSDDKIGALKESIGGLGGGALGATIGSLIMPGIGTAIGGALGGMGGSALANQFTGMKEQAKAALPTGNFTKELEVQMAAFVQKGSQYGRDFSNGFVSGINGTSVLTWLQTTIYPQMNQAVVNSGLFGSGFAKNFSIGANNSGASVYPWIQTGIYIPIIEAIGNGTKFGSAFAKNFSLGANASGANAFGWIQAGLYQPILEAISNSPKFGSEFTISFGQGMRSSKIDMHSWLSINIYQPLNTLIANSRLFGSAMIRSFIMGRDSIDMSTRFFLVNEVDLPFLDLSRTAPYWGSGMMNQFIAGMRSKGKDVSAEARTLAGLVEKAFRAELDIHSPSRKLFALGRFSGIGFINGLGDADIKSFAEKHAGSVAASFSGMGNFKGGAASAEQVRAWITQALMITGTPMSWLGPLMTKAYKESTFNPRAINLWDSNAKRGTPSKGLLQTIDPTFNAYKMAGMNDIWNPVHNVVAAIRYIKSRYGSVFNTPGIRSMSKGGGYKGYATGTNGPLTTSQWAWVGEEGPELMYLHKGTEIFSHKDSMNLISGRDSLPEVPSNRPKAKVPEGVRHHLLEKPIVQGSNVGTSVASSLPKLTTSKIINQFQSLIGEVHVHNEADENRLLQKIKQLLQEEIDNSGEVLIG